MLLATACEHESLPVPAVAEQKQGLTMDKQGALTLKLEHTFGDAPFSLEPQTYITSSQDTVNVNELMYYLTNVSLMKENGEYINLGNYHLVDFTNPSTLSATIPGVPAGVYSRMRIYLGVDSAHNHTLGQTGALDPGFNMAWDWNTGYIFIKLSGKFNRTGSYSFHLGGDVNLPVIEFDLGAYKVRSVDPVIGLRVDLAKFFGGSTFYGLTTNPTHIHNTLHPSIPALVDNMRTMVSISSVN
jgi:hypothetical protein